MKRLGIYIHIPFCKSKCNYCDFNSYAGKDDKQKDYLFAHIKEINDKSCDLKDYEVDTIYIGGGTPSNLFSGAIQTILAEIKKSYKVLSDAEISIEANPNTITFRVLAAIKDLKQVVEVVLVTGVTPAIIPIGSAISM